MSHPPRIQGLHHVALWVKDLEACEKFYVDILGMTIEWKPDPDNLYLRSEGDNFALHRSSTEQQGIFANPQRLDHIGFVLRKIEDVDLWYDYLVKQNVTIKTQPRTHRDGARSFYFHDPEGIAVQMIYHPPISKAEI